MCLRKVREMVEKSSMDVRVGERNEKNRDIDKESCVKVVFRVCIL